MNLEIYGAESVSGAGLVAYVCVRVALIPNMLFEISMSGKVFECKT